MQNTDHNARKKTVYHPSDSAKNICSKYTDSGEEPDISQQQTYIFPFFHSEYLFLLSLML